MRYEVKPHKPTCFFVHAICDDGGLAGLAEYYIENALWKCRVDVKKKYINQGIGTELLREGDKYLRKNYPGEVREFETRYEFKGKTYMNEIPAEDLISYEGNKLRFRLSKK